MLSIKILRQFCIKVELYDVHKLKKDSNNTLQSKRSEDNHVAMALVAAKYSRNNKGLDEILSKVDLKDNSFGESLTKLVVDFGHQSVKELTNTFGISLEGITNFAASEIFRESPCGSGIESSTRYIKMNSSSLPDPISLGIPEKYADEWYSIMTDAYKYYDFSCKYFNDLAKNHPERLRIPNDLPDNVRLRLKKNYYLDRSRYFIPFATKTNMIIFQNIANWEKLLKKFYSSNHKELITIADKIKNILLPYVGPFLKYANKDKSYEYQNNRKYDKLFSLVDKIGITNIKDDADLHILDSHPDWFDEKEILKEDLQKRKDRYSAIGEKIESIPVRFFLNNLAIAEYRDLNRHRLGKKSVNMIPYGFYLPDEFTNDPHITEKCNNLLQKYLSLTKKLMLENNEAFVYCLLFGTQIQYSHSTQLGNLIYTGELRTGPGSHYRYSDHLKLIIQLIYNKFPQLKGLIKEGNAEPE